LYAGFLTLAAILAFFVITGTAPQQTPPGGPPSLGVWNDKPTAPDKWATAAEETRKASGTTPQEAASTEDAPSVQPVTPIRVTEAASMPPREAVAQAPSQPSAGDTPDDETVAQQQSEPSDTTTRPPHADTAAIADQRPATANAVEAAPRPVEQMSEGEIQAAIHDYEGWLHRGQITVRLDYTMLSGPQIDAIAGAYVMQSSATRTEAVRLVITSNGVPISMSDEALEKVLIGDLTPDRHRWPPCLQAKVSWFGPNAAVTAKMVLRDAVALQLYRVLAEQAGTVQPLPGTVCRVQLIPTNEQIDVRLVSFYQPKEPRL
jgi:hypothetical protein